jgi:hypothetical protein
MHIVCHGINIYGSIVTSYFVTAVLMEVSTLHEFELLKLMLAISSVLFQITQVHILLRTTDVGICSTKNF